MTPAPASASIPVSLRRQFPDASFIGCAEIVVTAATDRSGDCTPGCLFAALPGTKVHGRTFVADAVARGAAAILTDAPLSNVRACQCIVADVRAAYSRLCHTLERWPSRQLGVAGVTGTNGKTTTTWLIRALLACVQRKCGLAGTIEYSDGDDAIDAPLTTPDARTLSRWLAAARDNNCSHFALELSSHALDQDRPAGLMLDAAVVTNVTQDHFDYHGTFDRYRAAKGRIAQLLKRGGRLILNADDPGSASLGELTPSTAHCHSFGIDAPADVQATRLDIGPHGSRFTVTAGTETSNFTTALLGRHNVSNCLAAACVGLHFGLSLAEIAAGIATLRQVPGRMQAIDCGQPFQVLVDYAHTPDALQRVVAAARQIAAGRVLCVFGAGGDRDRSKRADMGRAGAAADVVVITSDNPRSEDPQSIMYDLLAGCVAVQVHVDPDREAAIGWALRAAHPGDVVLIAGKGHERVQIIGNDRIPFDDAAICRKYLALRHAAPHFHVSERLAQTA